MSNFNPYAKKTTQQVEEFEEVELMAYDSVEYFKEKAVERQQNILNAKRLVEERKQLIANSFKVAEEATKKAKEKQNEILEEIQELREEQKNIAKQITTGADDSGKLEKKLTDISLKIISAEAKVTAFDGNLNINITPELKLEIKKHLQEYDAALNEYRNVRKHTSLIDEIEIVIKELKEIKESISNFYTTDPDNSQKIIKQFAKYFITEDLIEKIGISDRDILENYFEVWLKTDTNYTFLEYANYLNSL